MILVLLGTQDAPFPRIIDLVIASQQTDKPEAIFVQAGYTHYPQAPAFVEVTDFLTQVEFQTAIERASVVVCHGGAGTMLTAMQKGKQVIAIARKHAFAEHNNDHQSELVDKLAKEGYLQAVQTEAELKNALARIANGQFQPRRCDLTNGVTSAVEQFIDALEL